MTPSAYYVYGLRVAEGRPFRYIGLTVNLTRRLAAHVTTSRNARKGSSGEWIRGLRNAGRYPQMVILEIIQFPTNPGIHVSLTVL